MDTSTLTAPTYRAPFAAWPRLCAVGRPLVGASGAAKHSQKDFTMADTGIDGWPLGPRNGTSG